MNLEGRFQQDMLRIYDSAKQFDYYPNTRHETVNHSEDEWVVYDVHTNSIEGVWSLFKRSLIGAYHKVSCKHLGRYLEELEWRFTNRNNNHIFRDTLQRIVKTKYLTYQRLTA